MLRNASKSSYTEQQEIRKKHKIMIATIKDNISVIDVS